jgi:multicomponent K+:H+ antiporter subunit D
VNPLHMHLPILLVLLPLAAGILLLLLQGKAITLQRSINLAATLVLAGLSWVALEHAANGAPQVYLLGNWLAPFGIVLVLDMLAAWMLVATALLALFALSYACLGTDQKGRSFHVLFQLQLFGLNGAFLTGDLFNLFVFFEILLLASYGLLLHGGGRDRVRGGLHFVIINLVGSTLFLFAVGTLYGVLGTLNMADLALKISHTPSENLVLVQSASLLLLIVFALKAALLPLYLWLPAAYGTTSAPVAALFAIMTKVGLYSILRVFGLFSHDAHSPLHGWLFDALIPVSLATLLLATLGALASTRLRQQIAYLVIASAGMLLLSFSLDTVPARAAGLYYLWQSSFATAAAFLLADLIRNARGDHADRFEPGPILQRGVLLGSLFFVVAIALVGLPPLAGFLAKFMLLQAATEHSQVVWIWSIVLLSGVIALIALARSGSLLFYRAEGSVRGEHTTASSSHLTPIIGLLSLIVFMVIAANPLSEYALATAKQIDDPAQYQNAVLGRPAALLRTFTGSSP